MVIPKSVQKYTNRIGQNTGILKASKNVQNIAISVALVAECLWNQIRMRQLFKYRLDVLTFEVY